MSLTTQLSNVVVRMGTEFKAVGNKIGNLTSLSTTNKSSLVLAINEVAASVGGGGGAPIDDATPSLSKVYSSQKTQSIVDAKPSINDTTPSGTTVLSGTKTNANIAAAVASKTEIDDVGPSSTKTFSSQKIGSEIGAAIASLIDSSPGALDTLNELAAALGDDPNFAATINTALGNRLRVDAAQSGFTEPQRAQGRGNLDVHSKAEVGNVATDFVAVFEAALI